MKELFRLAVLFFIYFLTIFFLKKTGLDLELICLMIIAAGSLCFYLADYLTRRFFPDQVMSLVLGVIAGGILTWVSSQWIFSLTFLSGYLEKIPWRPFLEIILAFLSILWISSAGAYSRVFIPFRRDYREKGFRYFYFFLMTLSGLALALLVLSKSGAQGLWRGNAVSDWVLSMARGNYDFQLNLQTSMNAMPVILGAGLLAIFPVMWIFRRHCIPHIGFVFVLFAFAGFLNHLLLEISGDILSAWMPSDVLQLFILLNAFYFGLSWGLHIIGQSDFRRSF